ncbi:MAG: endonuclease/exonuclease/phosphatase family protein [Armatimonadetes bacterium]|nr:endonuclease/exonuclease/phosphatase family protein [Armatimonadota bacterium]
MRSWVSVSIAALIGALYLFRPDATEAVTVWPAWLWVVPGVLLAWKKRASWLWTGVRWPLLAWLVVGLGLSELWRVVLPARGPGDLRVVTLNAAGEMELALEEAAGFGPDVLLLQESATVAGLEQFVDRTFGQEYDFVLGIDCSVLVRGKAIRQDTSATNFTFVTAQLSDGTKVDIVCLRMAPYWPRLDYWNPDCWRSYADHRASRRLELAEIWTAVQPLRTGAPLILGGDFNAVPDRSVASVVADDLKDSYASAGTGWYGTAMNDLPLFRIDQVWTSDDFKAVGSRSKKSAASDHRLVLADFDWTHPSD